MRTLARQLNGTIHVSLFPDPLSRKPKRGPKMKNHRLGRWMFIFWANIYQNAYFFEIINHERTTGRLLLLEILQGHEKLAIKSSALYG